MTAHDEALWAVSDTRVLIIDHDPQAADDLAVALRCSGLDVTVALGGFEGLAAARNDPFDLLFIDLQLLDLPGLDVLRFLRDEGMDLPIIAAGVGLTVPIAVEAMTLGAATVLERPLDVHELVVAVQTVMGRPPSPHREPCVGPSVPRRSRAVSSAPTVSERVTARSSRGSTAERWATMVLRVLDSPVDPKTLGIWARAIGVSESVLSECCRLVHVSPHDARDFARLLRAIHRSGDLWQPEALMDFADGRTLRRLLQRAGLLQATRVPTPREFLERQQWLPSDHPGLQVLRAALLIAGDGESPNR